MGDEVLGDGEVEVVLVADGVGAGAGLLEGDAHAARVGPVLGVRAVGLEDGGEAQGRAGVGDLARQGVADGQVRGHAAALGARARRVEVHGVEHLVVLDVVWLQAWLRGLLGRELLLLLLLLARGLLRCGGGGGWLAGYRAEDVRVLEVVDVALAGIGDAVFAVGHFFYPRVRHCVIGVGLVFRPLYFYSPILPVLFPRSERLDLVLSGVVDIELACIGIGDGGGGDKDDDGWLVVCWP